MNYVIHIEVKFVCPKTISYFATVNKYILIGNIYLLAVNSYPLSVFKKYILISISFHQYPFMFSSGCSLFKEAYGPAIILIHIQKIQNTASIQIKYKAIL